MYFLAGWLAGSLADWLACRLAGWQRAGFCRAVSQSLPASVQKPQPRSPSPRAALTTELCLQCNEKMAAERQSTIKQVYEDPRTGFGNLAETLKLARQRDPNITREDVKKFLDGLITREDRPQRGYNSYVPPEPMHQLQVDLADMGSFARGPYPYMLVAIDTFTKKATAVPMKDKTAKTAAEAWNKVVSDLGIPSYVYSDDGTEFKREFKEKLDYWDIEKLVSRGHAIVAERAIRTLKEALIRRLSAGVGRRNQWHLLLPDVLAQYNDRKHAGTSVTPNEAYESPQKALTALRTMRRRAKRGAEPRPELQVGNRVRVRVKPIESRGSYRVTETAWSERVYTIARIDYTNAGPLFTLDGWGGGRLVARDLRKVEGERQRLFPIQSRELRAARAAADRRADFPAGPVAPP